MIIDPHVFEVTLYTVKDLPPNYPPIPVQPPSLSAPQYNPFMQGRAYPPQTYNASLPKPNAPYPPQQHTHAPQNSLPPFREGFGLFGPQGPPSVHHPLVHTPAPVQNPLAATVPRPPGLPGKGFAGTEKSHNDGSEPKADPVIQMLATRAANDTELKNLMKIVASGKASQTQLREFQDHIDELNSILKSRTSPSPSFGIENSVGGIHRPSGSVYPPNPFQHTKADMSWNQTGSAAVPSVPHQPLPPIKVEPSSQTYPSAATPTVTKTSSSSKMDIHGVVFDFGGTGDRFSIPRFSILEYLYGGTQVLVSFIVIRRGSTAASGNYKGTMNYYQPVTLRLTTPHPKILEPLARVVAPPDEVRSYMNNYFDRLSPAETVYLATRLPRVSEAEDGGHQDSADQPGNVQTRPLYSPPNSIMPLAA